MKESARNGRKPSRLDETRLAREVSPRFKRKRMGYPGIAAVAVVLHKDETAAMFEIAAHQSEHPCLVFDEMKRVRHNDPVEIGQLEPSREVGSVDAQLSLRHGRHKRGSQLRERGAIAIDRADDSVRANEVGEREGERLWPPGPPTSYPRPD